MGFLIIIFTRLLFIACMVFILGYVFGPFAGKPVLRTITRVAAILVVILFIVTNVFAMRGFRGWHHHEGKPICTDEYYRKGWDTPTHLTGRMHGHGRQGSISGH
jgi:hypothetical protein